MIKKLDEKYESAFEEKIIKPITDRLNQRLDMYRPDTEGNITKTYGVASREGFEDILSHYISTQRIKRETYPGIEESAEKFFDFAGDKSLWHDTEKVKSVLLDTARTQSAMVQIPCDTGRVQRDKEYADELAKKIADKVNRELSYDPDHKIALLDEDIIKQKNIQDVNKIVGNKFARAVGGYYYFDFGNIQNLDELLGYSSNKE